MTYYLLEATLSGYIRDFLLQLIYSLWLMARRFYYITIDLLNWMIRKQSTDPVFVSVCLSDAHRNMNQKYVFFQNTLTSDGFSMLISYAAFTFWNIPTQVP